MNHLIKSPTLILILSWILGLVSSIQIGDFATGTLSKIFKSGGATDDNFAKSVASAGKFDEDDFDDIIIGVNGRDMAYVIYGGANMATLSDIDLSNPTLDPQTTGFTITGYANSDFGWFVNCAGDVNKDGYDDIIIGAPDNTQATTTGSVYVIYGGPKSNMQNIVLSSLGTKGFSVSGLSTGDNLGYSVKSAGDINNDNYDDIIIGAPYRNGNQGEAYIIYGGERSTLQNFDLSNLDSTSKGFKITGGASGDYLGRSVSGAGDINGDNYDDIIVGAYENAGKGAAYVIYGGDKASLGNMNLANGLDSSKGFKISGEAAGDQFGWAVSGAGKINEDQYHAFMVSAPQASSATGTVYVIYGGPDKAAFANIQLSSLTPSTTGFRIKGNAANDKFGTSLNNVGDVNKDGFGDLIVGAWNKDSAQGAAYVIYGRKKSDLANLDLSSQSLNLASTGFEISGPAGLVSRFGQSPNTAGDVNNDGYSDIIIGAPKGNFAYLFIDNRCPDHCKTCPAPSKCTTCKDFYQPPSNNKCSVCVTSAYKDANDVCQGCPTLCATCSSSSSCQSCKPGLFFYLYQCYNACPIKTFQSSSTQCSGCPSNCDKCSDGSTCTECSSPFRLYNSQCYDPCPITTFALNPTQCAACPSDCDKCSDGSTCTECSPGYRLYQSQCYASCPIKTFPSSSTQCSDCSTNCDTCTDSSHCTLCSTGYRLYQSKCHYPCPIKTFASSSTQCSDCSANCDACTDTLHCTQCSPNWFLWDYKCFDPCPVGTCPLGNDKCQACPQSCAECTSMSVCQRCVDGYGLLGTMCVICPTGMYLSDGHCLACPHECSECTSASVCQACIDGYTLLQSHMCYNQESGDSAADGVLEGTSLLGSSLGSGNSFPLNFGLAAKILRNFKYLDVTVSLELQKTFFSWKVGTGFIKAPKSWSSISDSKPLPVVFSRYGLDPVFLINYWKPLIMALIGFVLFVIFKSVEMMNTSNKTNKISLISRQINIAASNFALTQFYSYLDDSLFYFVLDMRTTGFDGSFRVVSCILAMILLLTAAIFLSVHFSLLQKYQTVKDRKKQLERFTFKFENVKLIFQDFNDVTFFIQSFLLLNLTRSLISSLLFTLLFEYPLLQMLLLLTLNLTMIVYLVFKRPFKDGYDVVAQLFCEFILLIAIVCMLVLVLFDQKDSSASREILSKCIIIMNLILLLGSAAFILFKSVRGFYVSYQQKKKAKLAGSERNVPRNVLNQRLDAMKFKNEDSSSDLTQSQSEKFDQSIDGGYSFMRKNVGESNIKNNSGPAYQTAMSQNFVAKQTEFGRGVSGQNNNFNYYNQNVSNFYAQNNLNVNIQNQNIIGATQTTHQANDTLEQSFHPNQTEDSMNTSNANLLYHQNPSKNKAISRIIKQRIKKLKEAELEKESKFRSLTTKTKGVINVKVNAAGNLESQVLSQDISVEEVQGQVAQNKAKNAYEEFQLQRTRERVKYLQNRRMHSQK